MDLYPAIEVVDVAFIYAPARRGTEPFPALRGVSFYVSKGEIFGLLGPNGGGKTTLFRILATLLVPSKGYLSIAGLNVRDHPHEVRKQLGIAFQSPSLDKKLTARENLLHHGRLYGLSGRELRDRIKEVLELMNLSDRTDALTETLSGGMARRLELAKTLLHRPKVLLLDEPSTGLDPGARRDLWRYLKLLQSQSEITVLLTTHLMEEAAECDRLALLDAGRIVASGTPGELTAEIGGDVITVRSHDPERLLNEIPTRFGISAARIDGGVRLERDAGHNFIPQLVEAFPGLIQEVSLGKPTLEDVFISRTGRKLD